MFLSTEEDVCILLNMFFGINSIVFKIKIRTCCIEETLTLEKIFGMEKK